MISAEQFALLNVLYDLMEKAQYPSLDMIDKWGGKRGELDSLVRMRLTDLDSNTGYYWITVKGMDAMGQYNYANNYTPLMKLEYNLHYLQEEIKKLGIDTSCGAGRKTCIDCSISEMKLSIEKLKKSGVA